MAQAAGDVAGRLLELVQILADAEAAPGAGEDDGANVRLTRFFERADELAVHLGSEGVEDIRAVEGDRQDRSVPGRLDFRHLASSFARPWDSGMRRSAAPAGTVRSTFGTVPSQTRAPLLDTLAAGRRLGAP